MRLRSALGAVLAACAAPWQGALVEASRRQPEAVPVAAAPLRDLQASVPVDAAPLTERGPTLEAALEVAPLTDAPVREGPPALTEEAVLEEAAAPGAQQQAMGVPVPGLPKQIPGLPQALPQEGVTAVVGAPAAAASQAPAAGAVPTSTGQLTLREEVCRYCYRQCPVSCFAGTCSLSYGAGVRRFQATSFCYTCDAQGSAGVDPTSDLKLCSTKEAAAAVDYPRAMIKGDKNPALRGPGVPGDAGKEAKRATEMAYAAQQQLQAAAATAERAALHAVHDFRTGGASPMNGGPFVANASEELADRMQVLQAHGMATQIRAEQALRFSEEAHDAWKIALNAYNKELFSLRKEQLKAAQLEEAAEHARQIAVKARQDYAAFAAEAAEAARQELITGDSYSKMIVQQANAEELASNARAAQRRLMIAASEAKTASTLTARALELQPYDEHAPMQEALPVPALVQRH